MELRSREDDFREQLAEHCKGMEGLLVESEEIIGAEADGAARDGALIAAGQPVEQYEIAEYGTARTLVDELGCARAGSSLGETLSEEADADKRLTKIAAGGLLRKRINDKAAA